MEHKNSTSGIANKGAEPGSLPRASTGTAVMIHAPAEAGGGEAAWPPSIPQRRESALAARAHPSRVAYSRRAASGWLSGQAADPPEPAPLRASARVCPGR